MSAARTRTRALGEEFPMADARCSCGALTLKLPERPRLVVACHCLDCQRRTGAPFGVGAFYPVEAAAISGASKEFTRDAASGGKVRSAFCPNCGSTVYWKADNPAVADRRRSRRAGGPERSPARQIGFRAVETRVGSHRRRRTLPAKQRGEKFRPRRRRMNRGNLRSPNLTCAPRPTQA